jgi:hypothetical protein
MRVLIALILLFRPAAWGAENLTYPLGLDPRFEKYTVLLENPAYLIAILEGLQVKFRDIERFQMNGGTELKLFRSTRQPFYEGWVRFEKQIPGGFRYRIGVLWNLEIFKKLSETTLDILTEDLKTGKVTLVVHLESLPDFIRKWIPSSEMAKPVNPNLQEKLLAYLETLPTPFSLTSEVREKILVDFYNNASRSSAAELAASSPARSGHFYFILTLFIWLAIVPLAALTVIGWLRFRRRNLRYIEHSVVR